MLSSMEGFRRAAWGIGLVLACMMGANAQDTITVILGEGTTNPGGSVEIPVTLDSGGASPSTLVLFVAYDPLKLAPYMDYYERIRTGSGGQIIYDANGNALTDPSPLSMADALSALGVNQQTEVHAQGVMGIILFQSTGVLPDGLLFKLAFRVLDGAASNEEIRLDGISTDHPILIGGVPAASSASTSSAESLNVLMLDGRIFTGCTAAAIPGNVIASQGRPDAVEVTWSAIAAPYTQYRVFRSNSNDPLLASPLGDGWQMSTAFVDFSAKAPVLETKGVCCRPAVYREQRHYYWVKARTGDGCESGFSVPAAEGYRGLSKMSTAMDGTVASVFPASPTGSSEQWAAPGDTLAIWLSSEEEVNPETVWAQVEAKEVEVESVEWIPVSNPGARGGWLTVAAPGGWAETTEVVLRAGAQSRTGRSIGPQVRQFQIRTDAECPVRSPIGRSLQEIPADSVSVLAEGIGSAYRILPETVYSAPRRIWLPVPEDIRPENLTLYYFSSVGGDFRWYPGERVAGWLAPGVERLRRGSVTYLGFEVRHGGLARLGYVPGKVPVAVAPAAVASAWVDQGDLQGLIAIGIVVALLMLLGFRPCRSHG